MRKLKRHFRTPTVYGFRTESSVLFGYVMAQLIDHNRSYTCTEIRDLLQSIDMGCPIQRIAWNMKMLVTNGFARRIEVELEPVTINGITYKRTQARYFFD